MDSTKENPCLTVPVVARHMLSSKKRDKIVTTAESNTKQHKAFPTIAVGDFSGPMGILSLLCALWNVFDACWQKCRYIREHILLMLGAKKN